ncbi:MAG: hypothetical protein QOJ54_3029, partial [Aliidongia sp.]|nr:hypothetical protein [Aliidongia sp.]
MSTGGDTVDSPSGTGTGLSVVPRSIKGGVTITASGVAAGRGAGPVETAEIAAGAATVGGRIAAGGAALSAP